MTEWFDLYERAQNDPKAVPPEALNAAFNRLRAEARPNTDTQGDPP